VGQVGSNLLLRRHLVDDVDPWLLATVLQTGVAVPLLFALPFVKLDTSVYTPTSWALIAAAAALAMGFLWTNVKSLQEVDAGVYSILFNLRIVFVTILGIILLSEPVAPLQMFGGLLIFLSVVTLSNKRHTMNRPGLVWGLSAALIVSLLAVIEKHLISTIGLYHYFLPAVLTSTLVMWGILIYRHAHVPWRAVATPGMGALMALKAAGAYGFTGALALGAPVSIATYISCLAVVLIVLLAAVWLRETDHMRQKLTATGLAVAGLTAILASNFI
jgi:drug/metabolite transporter (DMT)-like permease